MSFIHGLFRWTGKKLARAIEDQLIQHELDDLDLARQAIAQTEAEQQELEEGSFSRQQCCVQQTSWVGWLAWMDVGVGWS